MSINGKSDSEHQSTHQRRYEKLINDINDGYEKVLSGGQVKSSFIHLMAGRVLSYSILIYTHNKAHRIESVLLFKQPILLYATNSQCFPIVSHLLLSLVKVKGRRADR